MVGLLVSPSSLKPAHFKQSIATSETALKLGDTTAPGYILVKNTDPTNYIDLKVAASGAIFARLDAGGGCCLVKLGSGAQVPVLIASTAACLIDCFLIPA